MRKLATFILAATLLTSCGGLSHTATPSPVSPCVVPPAPEPPDINPVGCGDQVCLTLPDAVALSTWINAMREVELAVQACNLVVRR